MDKGEMLERLARLFEEGRVVIPSRIPVELLRWRPESDASLALRFALAMALRHGAGRVYGCLQHPGESGD